MRDQAGFTLLELLIAMTLMGMVLVTLYGGLRIAARGWDAGEQRAEALSQTSLVEDFIRRQLRQSLTLFRPDPNQGRVLVFVGEPERISLVAPLLSHLGRGGLYVIELDSGGQANAGQLRMRWRPYRPEGPEIGFDEEAQTILLDNVTGLQWAYFGAQSDAEAPRWHEYWHNIKQRPVLVRLSLRRQGEALPDLLAALSD